MEKLWMQLHPLPNDILRKIRKSKVARKVLLRMSRMIKETEGFAFTEEIARSMNLNVAEVRSLVEEAKRQRIPISVRKDQNGKEFLKAE